jgi:hypothetical protein
VSFLKKLTSLTCMMLRSRTDSFGAVLGEGEVGEGEVGEGSDEEERCD